MDGGVLQDGTARDDEGARIFQTLEERRSDEGRSSERHADSEVVDEKPDRDNAGSREADQDSLADDASLRFMSCAPCGAGSHRCSRLGGRLMW